MRNILDEPEKDAHRLHLLLLDLARKRPLRDPLSGSFEAHNFTHPQIHTLMWCGHDGALTMGELARRLCITEKTVTRVIDRLEESKHVKRVRSQQDRRVVRVQLTRKGAAAYRKLENRIQDKMTRLMSLLDPPDRRALFGIVEKLHARLRAVSPLLLKGKT